MSCDRFTSSLVLPTELQRALPLLSQRYERDQCSQSPQLAAQLTELTELTAATVWIRPVADSHILQLWFPCNDVIRDEPGDDFCEFNTFASIFNQPLHFKPLSNHKWPTAEPPPPPVWPAAPCCWVFVFNSARHIFYPEAEPGGVCVCVRVCVCVCVCVLNYEDVNTLICCDLAFEHILHFGCDLYASVLYSDMIISFNSFLSFGFLWYQ